MMIDESQLLFIQAASKTLKASDNVRLMWEALTHHIANAKCVRMYDGFMGRLSIDVLKGIGIANVSVVTMPETVPNNNRTMFIRSVNRNMEQKEWLTAWAIEIGRQVEIGKNVMVFSPFNHETRYCPSMEQIMRTTCHRGGIDIDADTVMHYGGWTKKKRPASSATSGRSG
jgi:hypothetical protein